MIKDNPLYKDHKDMFKKRFGLAYYLRKFVSYPSNESFMFVTLAFVMFSMLSGIFFKTQQFLLGSLTIGIYITMFSCYIYQIYYLKTYHKDIPLEKRKEIIKSILKYIEQIKTQYNMEDNETRNVIEEFSSSQNTYFEHLLSDSTKNIKKGFDHFFNDGDEYMFNFENDIKGIDEKIAKNKQQQVSRIAEKIEQERVKCRLADILGNQTETATN